MGCQHPDLWSGLGRHDPVGATPSPSIQLLCQYPAHPAHSRCVFFACLLVNPAMLTSPYQEILSCPLISEGYRWQLKIVIDLFSVPSARWLLFKFFSLKQSDPITKQVASHQRSESICNGQRPMRAVSFLTCLQIALSSDYFFHLLYSLPLSVIVLQD